MKLLVMHFVLFWLFFSLSETANIILVPGDCNFFSLACNCVIHCYRKKIHTRRWRQSCSLQKCLSAKTRTTCIANQLTDFLMMRALFAEQYSRTDHNVFSEIPLNKSSHYIGTSRFIYIANQLTGSCKAQVSTEKHFRTYTKVSS